MQNLTNWIRSKFFPGSLSAADRKALVALLRTKARGAALTGTNFPVAQYPEAAGKFVGREEAYTDAAALLETK